MKVQIYERTDSVYPFKIHPSYIVWRMHSYRGHRISSSKLYAHKTDIFIYKSLSSCTYLYTCTIDGQDKVCGSMLQMPHWTYAKIPRMTH